MSCSLVIECACVAEAQPTTCPTCEGGGVTYTNPEEPGPDEITCETCGGEG